MNRASKEQQQQKKTLRCWCCNDQKHENIQIHTNNWIDKWIIKVVFDVVVVVPTRFDTDSLGVKKEVKGRKNEVFLKRTIHVWEVNTKTCLKWQETAEKKKKENFDWRW